MIMGLFGSKPVFSMKTDEQLWYEISENLSELSRRDKVDYRVRATRDSVKQKLEELNLLCFTRLVLLPLLLLLFLST